MLAVTGATGNLGHLVVKDLLDAYRSMLRADRAPLRLAADHGKTGEWL